MIKGGISLPEDFTFRDFSQQPMQRKPLFVRAEWDDEARVWAATSDDISGLATEDDNLEGLIDESKVIIPDLLEAKGLIGEAEVPFEILTRRFQIAQRVG